MSDQVTVVGLGYIGLPTAAALASRGVNVLGVDVDQRIVDLINKGEAPFVEPDLAVAVSGAVAMGRLRASTTHESSSAFVLAVPTPMRDGKPDLSYVDAAADAIAPHLQSGALVVLESTSPPGTTRALSARLALHRPDLRFPHDHPDDADVAVAHCPERVLPGRIMIEIVSNDRVIGGVSDRCAERARELYEVFTQGEVHLTDATTAETTKLVENAYRDVNIAFANELSLVSDHLEIDVHEVIGLANRHPRVNILNPGPGVGGHCIAVDPWFLVAAAPEQTPLIRAARQVNDRKPHYVVEEVVSRAERFKEPVIAVLGLAFKANVDDLRESPALAIAEELGRRGVGRLLVVEPHVDSLASPALQAADAKLVDVTTAIAEADIVVLLVDHESFRRVRRTSLRGKVVFDTRGLWR
ncbi:MAG: UDP-N-acetyl-D-mannosaminuronic acid dehydrogenase [Frankiaceae bacterium]|nr:UDP-N-acetyl-D-mannosaminuronic acid dehydrogenase [Frankiaceae bacterium]